MHSIRAILKSIKNNIDKIQVLSVVDYTNQQYSTTTLYIDVVRSHLAGNWVITNCISITLQIAQIEIANWKYTQWKHVNFAKKTHILHI